MAVTPGATPAIQNPAYRPTGTSALMGPHPAPDISVPQQMPKRKPASKGMATVNRDVGALRGHLPAAFVKLMNRPDAHGSLTLSS